LLLSAIQHPSPTADDVSSVSLWLPFPTFSAHTGFSKGVSFGTILNVTKAVAEHAAPESGSPVMEDLSKLVKTKTRSSVTSIGLVVREGGTSRELVEV